jgi:hypothetical protein
VRNFLLATTLLAAVGVFPAITPANATLQLSITANGSTFTCSDGELSCDVSGGASNLLTIDTTVGGAFAQLTLAQSTFGHVNELQLSSASILNLSGAPITIGIAASDVGFTPPVEFINESASLTFNNAVGSGASTLAFLASAANLPFVGTTLFTTSGTPTTDPDSFSGTHSDLFSSSVPFSMTEAASLNLATGGSITGFNQAMETGVPELSTWAMLIAGFGFMGLYGLRQRNSRSRLA